MLNLFQHLIKSIRYEPLKRVQGDKKCITTQSPRERGFSIIFFLPLPLGIKVRGHYVIIFMLGLINIIRE
jgi:hypothetical protein